MTHGITHGYDNFSQPDIFWNHLKKVKAQEDKIWTGTFAEVGSLHQRKKEYPTEYCEREIIL